MKRIITYVLIVLLTAVMVSVPIQAAETHIVSGDYDISILENGNAEITETWILYFGDEQTYSRYFRGYYKTDYYHITDWTASLDGQSMEMLSNPDDLRPDGFFAVEETEDEYIIHLYHSSSGAERTFTISYTVENAVKLYDDIGDFVWDLTGSDEFSAIDKLTASVEIPQGSALDDFRIWAHGPLHGTFVKESEYQASLNIEFVGSSEIVDIRICAPSHLFTGGYYESGEKLQDILDYEKGLADDANALRAELEEELRQREEFEREHPVLAGVQDWMTHSPWAMAVFVISLVVAMAAFVFVPALITKGMDKKSKPHYTPEQNPEYYRMLPDDTPPAVLNSLLKYFPKYNLHHISSGDSFSSTMLDLFSDGFLEMRKTAEDDIEISVNGEKVPELDYERILISIITTALSGKPSGTLKEIQRYINGHSSEIYDMRKNFDREVKAHTDHSPYLEEYVRNKSRLIKVYIILGVIAAFAVPFYAFVMGSRLDADPLVGGVLAVILIGLLALACGAIPKKDTTLSQIGADKSVLWMAFGKFLDDFTSFKEKEFPEFKLWEKYLVYAIALGKSKNLINELALYYPVENADDIYGENYMHRRMYTEAVTAGYLFSAINDITDSTYSTGSSSSDSGGGGGFSSSGGSSGSGSSGSGVD